MSAIDDVSTHSVLPVVSPLLQRRLEERQARRDAIVDAAERAFAAKEIDGATVGDVAAKARLSRALLYTYFDDKDDFLIAVAHRTGRSDLSERFSSTVPSAVFGGELGLASGGGRAFVDVRYNVGLGGLLDDEAFGGTAPDLTAGGLAVTVGGAFNISRLLSQSR